MAPIKTSDSAEAGKTKKVYVPTGKPRGRAKGQKSKKTLRKEKAAEMRKKGKE